MYMYLVSVARRDYNHVEETACRGVHSPLDEMLVHPRVTPPPTINKIILWYQFIHLGGERANARNVPNLFTVANSHIINAVDKTKLSLNQ